jgi:hypothetical protein
MESGSGGVAASSGAVLWLEVEAREGTVGAASERRRKHGGSTLLKGGAAGTQQRGAGSQATRGAERGREGGLGTAGNGLGGRHRPPAGGCGQRRCRATAADDGMRATDKRDRATAGPGGK